MRKQSQERLPYSAVLPEYVPTPIATELVLHPTPSSQADSTLPLEVSAVAPNGWQEGTGAYVLALVDFSSPCPNDVTSVATISLVATVHDQFDAFASSAAYDTDVLPEEYRVGGDPTAEFHKNVPIIIGPLDLTGFSILSRIDLEISRNDDWPGEILIKHLILLTPQDSIGSNYPRARSV